MKLHHAIVLTGILVTSAYADGIGVAKNLKNERIKAFCIDFNWGPGGPNGFARPGLWAEADPVEHVQWYKNLGANTIQTFAVSCNGYAWYKNGIVPEQPGLKHDFLTEVVKLGHAEGLRVMGYFCIGANTRWGMEHPDLSLGIGSGQHIPLTDEYLSFLAASIKDALVKTDMDGFMVDWVWGPRTMNLKPAIEWLDCEKKLFAQVMKKPFPGADKLSQEDHIEYERRTIERCWNVIHKTAKSTKPNCIIWLSCSTPDHPSVVGSRMFKEVDWLMNENPDPENLREARRTAGPHTRIMQCLAGWVQHDAGKVLRNPKYSDLGLYGFARPDASGFPPEVGAELDPTYFPGAQADKAVRTAMNIEVLRKAYRGDE